MQGRVSLGTVWIRASQYEAMAAEAKRHASLETGGVLMGYVDAAGATAVIEQVIGPGPGARHSPTRFIPDYEFQEREVARLYEELDRRATYLGDWHTHPDGAGALSRRDLQTLAQIALSREARIPSPIMVVLSGPEWSITAWAGEVRRDLWRSKFVTSPLRVVLFSPGR